MKRQRTLVKVEPPLLGSWITGQLGANGFVRHPSGAWNGFASIMTSEGLVLVWGLRLEAALELASARTGDYIAIQQVQRYRFAPDFVLEGGNGPLPRDVMDSFVSDWHVENNLIRPRTRLDRDERFALIVANRLLAGMLNQVADGERAELIELAERSFLRRRQVRSEAHAQDLLIDPDFRPAPYQAQYNLQPHTPRALQAPQASQSPAAALT